MRYLTIPPDVPTKDLSLIKSDTFSFNDLFRMLVVKFPMTTVEGLKILDSVGTKMKDDHDPGDVVDLTDEEYAAFQAALNAFQLNELRDKPDVQLRLLAFYMAVAGAPDKLPPVEPPPPPED